MAVMPMADALFLLAERREQPMHVGGLQIFELPPGADDTWLAAIYGEVAGSTDVAPLFRRRPHRSVDTLGALAWQDDGDVDLHHHVRHSALPRPGRVRELLELTSRLHGTLLDRHRPLWEAHLVEGLEGGRFAVYSKIHHSLMDGVSALRLLAQTLSPDPAARDMPMPWSARPRRSRPDAPHPGGRSLLELLGAWPAAGLRSALEVAGLGPVAARAALRSLLDPGTGPSLLAPVTILNRPITGSRRFAAQAWPLERLQAVAGAAGTTLNDVVLAMCSGALRAYLGSLHALPDEALVAMTPVSLRQAGSDPGGNAVGAILCNLATNRRDPAERLEAVHAGMDRGKRMLRSMTPLQVTLASAAVMSPMAAAMTPGVRRFARPAFNLVISNIPGPAETLYWNGARLEGVYPLSIPTDGQALNVTVTSYAGRLQLGLTGCRRTVPHLQRLLVHLDESLSELEGAYALAAREPAITSPARAQRRSGPARPRPTPRPGTTGRRPGSTRPT